MVVARGFWWVFPCRGAIVLCCALEEECRGVRRSGGGEEGLCSGLKDGGGVEVQRVEWVTHHTVQGVFRIRTAPSSLSGTHSIPAHSNTPRRDTPPTQ